jgi:PKHD-type hydroxylase
LSRNFEKDDLAKRDRRSVMREFTGLEPFTIWDGAFTPKELDTIVAYGDALRPADATVMSSADLGQSIRVTRISWIERSQETLWLYQRLVGVTSSINQQAYCYDLSELESLQYTVYHAGEGSRYDWHVDQGRTPRRRKLSLVLQLSAPTDYEGCELQIYASSQIDTAPRTRGTLIAFPSYALHRVTPITAGTRKSLVMWCSGPRFR